MLDTDLSRLNQQGRTIDSAWNTTMYSLLAGFELKHSVEALSTDADYPALLVPDLFESTLKELRVGPDPTLFLFSLNAFADAVRPFEFGFYRSLGLVGEGTLPAELLSIGNFDLTVAQCGSGHFGSVFLLKNNKQASSRGYVLKVFYQRNQELHHSGPWNETALAAYVTGQKVYHMPRLCAANPARGWMLYGYVDADYRNPNWNGPSWSSLGLITLDPEKDTDNLICNKQGEQFRVDFGHLKTADRSKEPLPREILEVRARHSKHHPMTKDIFLHLLKKYPQARARMSSALAWIKRSERLETFKEIAQFKETHFFPVSDYFRASVLSADQLPELFEFLMEHENSAWRAQALFDTRKLPETTKEFLEKQWNGRPEFHPYRIFGEIDSK